MEYYAALKKEGIPVMCCMKLKDKGQICMIPLNSKYTK